MTNWDLQSMYCTLLLPTSAGNVSWMHTQTVDDLTPWRENFKRHSQHYLPQIARPMASPFLSHTLAMPKRMPFFIVFQTLSPTSWFRLAYLHSGIVIGLMISYHMCIFGLAIQSNIRSAILVRCIFVYRTVPTVRHRYHCPRVTAGHRHCRSAPCLQVKYTF
jgi:hypothetical protein